MQHATKLGRRLRHKLVVFSLVQNHSVNILKIFHLKYMHTMIFRFRIVVDEKIFINEYNYSID